MNDLTCQVQSFSLLSYPKINEKLIALWRLVWVKLKGSSFWDYDSNEKFSIIPRWIIVDETLILGKIEGWLNNEPFVMAFDYPLNCSFTLRYKGYKYEFYNDKSCQSRCFVIDKSYPEEWLDIDHEFNICCYRYPHLITLTEENNVYNFLNDLCLTGENEIVILDSQKSTP